jgi:hypothetical protein
MHLLDGDLSDKSRVTAHAPTPNVSHATATCYLEQLVAAAYDEAWSWLLSHGI